MSERFNALVFGRRQKGKSTLAFYLAEQRGSGIAIFDPTAQFRAWPFSTTSNIDEFEYLIRSGEFDVVVYRPEENVKAEFSRVGQILRPLSNFTFLVDEAWMLQKPSFMHEELDYWVRIARDVHLIQAMHRPVDACTDCRSLVSDLYFFQTTLSNDLETVAIFTTPEVAEKVRALTEHEFVHWRYEPEGFEVVTDPRSWFRDIKSPPGNFVKPEADYACV